MADGGHIDGGWLAAIIGAIGVALGGMGAWLGPRIMGKAAFQEAINKGFNSLLDQLQEERAASQAVVASLRAELGEVRADYIKSSAERAQLRGEIINLTQTIVSLKALLRRHGIDAPDTVASGKASGALLADPEANDG